MSGQSTKRQSPGESALTATKRKRLCVTKSARCRVLRSSTASARAVANRVPVSSPPSREESAADGAGVFRELGPAFVLLRVRPLTGTVGEMEPTIHQLHAWDETELATPEADPALVLEVASGDVRTLGRCHGAHLAELA